MSSPFDGMGAALMASLGAEVTHFPAAGGQFPRRWQIRTYPDESFPGEDRPVLDAVAELKLPRTDLDLVTWGDNGDEVEDPAQGRFRIAAKRQTPNPGQDALITFDLEEVTP